MDTAKTLLLVYQSTTGATEQMIRAVARGATDEPDVTVRQIARIATGWRLREIAPPLIICTHAQTTEAILAPKVVPETDLEKGVELGAAFAAGLAMGAF